MKLALLLLCHEPPVRLAHRLAMHFYRGESIKLYIHYDGNRPESDLLKLTQALPDDLQWRALRNRVACRWGEYSLVEATRRLIESALTDDFGADHLMLCSGSCVPIRPLSSLRTFLAQRPGVDFIQAHDIARGPWVKDGLEEERYRYYFPLNFLRQRRLFDRLTAWQRRLGVHRQVPGGLRIHFGSQWFCLTRATAARVLEGFERPGVVDFFRRCWIPDEFAIQSLAAAAVRTPSQIAGFTLTYYEFDDAGRPLVLDNGHEAHLAAQPFFFARKVAPEARGLLDHLDRVAAQPEADTGYFERVGTPTVDYQRFLLDVQLNRGLRAHVGTIVDAWRGPMDTSRRRYYVLVGSSRRHLMAVLARACGRTSLPIFCFPFDRPEPLIGADGGRRHGLTGSDGPRRDHDPCAYLHEIVHIDPHLPAAFGLDAAQEGWVTNFVPWDGNATLIDCDPQDLNADQRAAAALVESGTARDTDLMRSTLSSVLTGQEPPRGLCRRLRTEGKHSCHLLMMQTVAADWGDGTLRELRDAWSVIDPAPYFPSRERAASMIWQQ